jgi:hypothetical protein
LLASSCRSEGFGGGLGVGGAGAAAATPGTATKVAISAATSAASRRAGTRTDRTSQRPPRNVIADQRTFAPCAIESRDRHHDRDEL